MTIRPCPDCAQLSHFAPSQRTQRCWNCARFLDRADLRTPNEQLMMNVRARLDDIAIDFSRVARVARPALLLSVPCVAMMLLVGNSLHITIVRDVLERFR